MFKLIILIFSTYFSYAGIYKNLSSDGGLLSIQANGEVKRGEDFTSVWNYDSSEDRSFEHFFKNERSDQEVDKRDIFLNRNGEKMERYFEFTQSKSFISRDMNYRLSAITYKNGLPDTWVICRKEDECTVISQNFCRDVLSIDKESKSAGDEFARALSDHNEELFKVKKDALKFGREKISGIEGFLKIPYSEYFLNQFKKLSSDISKNKVDPFEIFGPGDSVMYECKLFQELRPHEVKDTDHQVDRSSETTRSRSK